MQTQEQEPDIGQKALRRKVPWLRLSFLALTVFIIIILGIFLIGRTPLSGEMGGWGDLKKDA